MTSSIRVPRRFDGCTLPVYASMARIEHIVELYVPVSSSVTYVSPPYARACTHAHIYIYRESNLSAQLLNARVHTIIHDDQFPDIIEIVIVNEVFFFFLLFIYIRIGGVKKNACTLISRWESIRYPLEEDFQSSQRGKEIRNLVVKAHS